MTRVSPYADSHATTTEIVEDWRQRAACRNADAELFHAPDGEHKPARRLREEEAKAFCRVCPVVVDCLAAALREEDDMPTYGRVGIRGGLTGDERTEQFGKPKRCRPAKAATT
jgi:WhiB family transcriptional regulator, redox-sensing transcriptional regulator